MASGWGGGGWQQLEIALKSRIMKFIFGAALAALLLTVSGCAPGSLSRSSGVPLAAGKLYSLELTFNKSFAATPFQTDLRVDNVSQPAQNAGRPNAYIVGRYIITYSPAVTNIQWFDGVSGGSYLLFLSAKLGTRNYFSVFVEPTGLGFVSSCEFSDWSFGDTTFEGSLLWRGKTGTSSASEAGSCRLSLKAQ